MKKNIEKALCNYEQLTTNISEIERAINQRPLTYVPEEMWELLTPYHMTFDKNIDDNGTTNFKEMIKGNALANVMMQRKLLSIFKKRLEAKYIRALREKHTYNRLHFLQENNVIVSDVYYSKKKAFRG